MTKTLQSAGLGFFLCLTIPSAAQEIIAHRGASHQAPENTLAAFRLAYEQDADAVELDLHLSQDNRIVVIHDKDTSRTAGDNFLVKETTSAELRNLDVGRWKNDNYTGEKIPFLDEVLEINPPGTGLYCEIKVGKEILPPMKAVIEQSGKKSDLRIISFDVDVVATAKEMMPEIPAYWIISPKKDEQTSAILLPDPGWIQIAVQRKLDGLDLNYAAVTQEFIAKAHEHGLKVLTWTVNHPTEAERLKQWGIDGITTDKPKLIMQSIKPREAEAAVP